jgi:hypothetical protein
VCTAPVWLFGPSYEPYDLDGGSFIATKKGVPDVDPYFAQDFPVDAYYQNFEPDLFPPNTAASDVF